MSTRTTTIEYAGAAIEEAVAQTVNGIGLEVRSRAYRVANELQNQANDVLRGQRHGRRYKVPGTFKRQRDKATGRMRNGVYYTASAPGEPPANRTGAFRTSWHRRVYAEELGGAEFNVHGVTESDLKVGEKQHLLGVLLDEGTSRMAPRPYRERVVEKAMPKVMKIYRESYGRRYTP